MYNTDIRKLLYYIVVNLGPKKKVFCLQGKLRPNTL